MISIIKLMKINLRWWDLLPLSPQFVWRLYSRIILPCPIRLSEHYIVLTGRVDHHQLWLHQLVYYMGFNLISALGRQYIFWATTTTACAVYDCDSHSEVIYTKSLSPSFYSGRCYCATVCMVKTAPAAAVAMTTYSWQLPHTPNTDSLWGGSLNAAVNLTERCAIAGMSSRLGQRGRQLVGFRPYVWH